MPQQSISSSSRKKKAGHKPAHQNTFAYRHNPNSKRTQQILSSANVGLCRRCHAKIEWRKQYRKYKPLTQPAVCNLCAQRTITAAYHTICDNCSRSPAAYDKMMASSMVTALVLEEPSSLPDSSISNHNAPSSLNHQTHKIAILVCAMCVKEPALTDASTKSHAQEIIQTEIHSQVERKEEILGRALKLREMKAVERKAVQGFKEEKERLRAERRNAAIGDKDTSFDANDCDDGVDSDDSSSPVEEEDLDAVNDVDIGDDEEYEHESEHLVVSDEEDDPFLKAVGGAHKLLVGDAYRQMILEKERQEQKKV